MNVPVPEKRVLLDVSQAEFMTLIAHAMFGLAMIEGHDDEKIAALCVNSIDAHATLTTPGWNALVERLRRIGEAMTGTTVKLVS